MVKTKPVLMKKFLPLLLLNCFLFSESHSQTLTRWVVHFRNKTGTPFTILNPATYLSQHAIDRRIRYGIAIDSTDLPITPRYIDSVRLAGTVTILNASKWLNQVSIQTSDSLALVKINSFPFVQSVSAIAARSANGSGTGNNKLQEDFTEINSSQRTSRIAADFFNYGNSFAQINIHNGQFLHNIGLRGQNMIIGILDAGFFNYTGLKSFDSVNANGQVLGTWDFVNREASVVEDNSHGMECFSIIAANIPGSFVGSAPKSNFHLFRTEDAATEYPIEEHNWACGAERLDSAGGDIISSSLGYNTFDDPSFNHTYADMNGNTTTAAIAADLAAKKGILVFNAAGNEGGSSWHYIVTPADGDSVVAVGAVTAAGDVAGFSSFGPSSDGQVKPDVASMGQGTTIQLTNNAIGSGNGTSFACPNMAGLAACLWQGFPEFSNMKIVNALKQSGNQSSTPDDRIGYGIPNLKLAFVELLKEFSTANASINNCRTTINWTSKDVSSMKYEIERKAPGETNYTKIGEKIPLAGNILSNHNYQYLDTLTNIQAGTISYRIRQVVDTANASFTAAYIDSVDIVLGSSCITTGIDPGNPNEEKISIMPNPARNQFILKVKTPYAIQEMKVNIIDMKGRLMMQSSVSKGSGEMNFTFPINRLGKGKYIVTVYNGKKLLAAKELLKL
jgi:serine protease AprX